MQSVARETQETCEGLWKRSPMDTQDVCDAPGTIISLPALLTHNQYLFATARHCSGSRSRRALFEERIGRSGSRRPSQINASRVPSSEVDRLRGVENCVCGTRGFSGTPALKYSKASRNVCLLLAWKYGPLSPRLYSYQHHLLASAGTALHCRAVCAGEKVDVG